MTTYRARSLTRAGHRTLRPYAGRAHRGPRSLCARCLFAAAFWLLTALAPSTAATEPLTTPRLAFDIVPLVLSSDDRGAPAVPPAAPSSNAAGDLAFVALERGRETLFLRGNGYGITGSLLAVGDALAGSTVARLATMAHSLDAYQDVLFFAVLADGREGLFRASPQPRALSVSPRWGYRDEPLALRVRGLGFGPDVDLFVGGVQASVMVVSRTELIGTVTTTAPVGMIDVVVSKRGAQRQVLAGGLELRERPASGCRGLWPDHHPPDVTASSLASAWMPWAVVVAYALGRRRLRRRRPRPTR